MIHSWRLRRPGRRVRRWCSGGTPAPRASPSWSRAGPCRCWWCPGPRGWTGGRRPAGTSPGCSSTGASASSGSRTGWRMLLNTTSVTLLHCHCSASCFGLDLDTGAAEHQYTILNTALKLCVGGGKNSWQLGSLTEQMEQCCTNHGWSALMGDKTVMYLHMLTLLTVSVTCDPDVLQLGHELAVEAAHGVAREEPGALAGQQLVNPGQ